MDLEGKKIGIMVEGDYYEPEIWYYTHRFAEEGVDLHFLSRMWGQTSEVMAAGFKGHEYKIPFSGYVESFEDMTDETLKSYAAIIVPGRNGFRPPAIYGRCQQTCAGSRIS